jgi:hypothetical protein
MKELLKQIKEYSNVDLVKVEYQESLSENPPIDNLRVIINTSKNLYEWAKCLYVKPLENNQVEVKVYCEKDPTETLIKEIYLQNKVIDWVAPSYGHDKPNFTVVVPREVLFLIINWKYSYINQ